MMYQRGGCRLALGTGDADGEIAIDAKEDVGLGRDDLWVAQTVEEESWNTR